jgi:putative RecB family exonuclease
MTLFELRNAPHLSVSSINDYTDCGLLYKLGRVDGYKPEFRADAMEFGSAIHMVLAEYYQQKMVGIDLSIKEIQEIFEYHWRRLAEGNDSIQYAEGKSFETILLEGKELLTTFYYKRPAESFEVIAIEEPFSFMIDGCSFPIIGAFDLIERDPSGTIIVVDNKTSGRAYSMDEVDRNFQLTVYQMAARSMGFSKEILLRFDCLIKTKNPKFEQYYTTRNDTDEIRARRRIIEVYKGISKGVYIPNDSSSTWKCKGCSFKKPCNDWFMEEAA